ncbi:hypothetical protein Gotur_003039 [Gossypium turneri]
MEETEALEVLKSVLCVSGFDSSSIFNLLKVALVLPISKECLEAFWLIATSSLYKQLECCKTAKVILDKLEDMFGGQSALARQFAITSLMNT